MFVSISYYYVFLRFSANLCFVNCKENIELVKKYIDHAYPMSCTFLGNWSTIEMKKIAKVINIPFQFWKIQEYLSDDEDFKIEHFNMLFILNFHSNGSLDVLYKASNHDELSYKKKWLILTSFPHENAHYFLKLAFGSIAFRFDSNVKVVTSSSSKKIETFFLYDIYNTGFGKNGSLVSEFYGYWNNSDGNLVVNRSQNNRYRRKSVLSGVTLKSSTVVRTSNITDSDLQEYLTRRTTVDMISKFSYSIFFHFMEMHNFTHIQIKRDKWFGNDVSGVDDGVAKDLYEGTVDVASTVCLMKISRLEYFDYMNPIYRFSSVFIFRNRGSHYIWQNEFLTPFTTGVWISMLIVLVVLSISLKLINWTEVKYLKTIHSYSSLTVILITIAIMCQQGSPVLPRHNTSRFIFFVILTFSFILYNYYTSSIVSALLNSKPKELTSFKDLIESGLQLGIQMAPYILTIFETNMNEDVQTIRRLVFPEEEKPHVWNITEGIEKVRSGRFAYHVESGAAYIQISKTFDSQAICEVTDKIGLIPPSLLTFWVKKDAQYRNLLKISLRRMEEVGLVQRNRKIWESEKPSCLANAILLSVGLDQTFIALFIMIVGYFIACLIMILEIMFVNYRLKKNRQ